MGGGGSTTTPPTVTQVPNPTNVPLQDPLAGASTRMINSAGAYAPFGSGAQLLPTANLGQVYMGGPNPTMFGNPTDPHAATGSFGQVGSYNEPGPNQTPGGYPQGQGGGGTSYNSIMSSLSGLFGGLSPQQQTQLGGVAQHYLGGNAPPPAGAPSGQPPAPAAAPGQSSAPPSAIGNLPPVAAPQSGNGAVSSQAPLTKDGGAGTSSAPAGAATPQAQQGAAGQFNTTGSPLPPRPTISGGQVLPSSQPGDLPILSPDPAAPDSTRNAFLPSSLTAPFYNQAAVAGNLGTAAGQAVQPAANFMQSLFGPGLSDMSQSYLQAGAANAGIGLQQGIGQLQNQYAHDPFNDALGRSEANLISQTANNTLQTAAGMGIQQQQIAANQMATPFNLTAQNAATGVQDAQGLFNMANAQYNAPYNLPMQVYSQIPVSAPVVTPGTQSAPKSII